jgi:hypothetical protein
MSFAEGTIFSFDYKPSIRRRHSTVLLTVRTWAVWNRDWRLTIGLPIFFVICWVPAFGVTAMFIKSLACKKDAIFHCWFPSLMSSADLPITAEFQDCLAIGSRVPSISWMLLLVYEAGQWGPMRTNLRVHLILKAYQP